MYYVYILQSEQDKTFYTGMTDNLERRIKEHNAGTMKYTRSRIPWVLVYKEDCATARDARRREKYWKSGVGREERNRMV